MKKKKLKAYIKRRKDGTGGFIVDVEDVNTKAGCITWWDGQWNRCFPEPNKVYEITPLDECILIQTPIEPKEFPDDLKVEIDYRIREIEDDYIR